MLNPISVNTAINLLTAVQINNRSNIHSDTPVITVDNLHTPRKSTKNNIKKIKAALGNNLSNVLNKSFPGRNSILNHAGMQCGMTASNIDQYFTRYPAEFI